MNDISYKSRDIVVRIDGVEYPVTARTKAVEAQLRDHDELVDSLTQYEADMSLMRILVGKEAAEQIFPDGDDEDLDRMKSITQQVLKAFNKTRDDLEAADLEEQLRQVEKITERTKSSIELISKASELKAKQGKRK